MLMVCVGFLDDVMLPSEQTKSLSLTYDHKLPSSSPNDHSRMLASSLLSSSFDHRSSTGTDKRVDGTCQGERQIAS